MKVKGARPRQWARRLASRATVPVRRRRYLRGGPRRLEVGSGDHPTEGCFHVDIYPWAPHLEAIAPMWKLPLPDNWAVELRATHSLEHVEPPRLVETLLEWRRVLAPGGFVQVSVPNGPAIMAAFTRAPLEDKWPLMGSLLGMYCNPESRAPESLRLRSDHQLVFDRDVLAWALTTAGFSDIEDLTEGADDRHSVAWRPLVDRYSLIMRATA
jgi:hypothetical protein